MICTILFTVGPNYIIDELPTKFSANAGHGYLLRILLAGTQILIGGSD